MPGCVPRLETGLGCRVIFGARMHAKVGYREIPPNLTDRGGTMPQTGGSFRDDDKSFFGNAQ